MEQQGHSTASPPTKADRDDAIVIPGGGLTDSGELPPWVVERLERTLELYTGQLLIPLSAATVHKPQPRDAKGYAVLEARVAGEWLSAHGVPTRHILCEAASYDTIGNAYFARVIHTDPRQLRRLTIITSEFHMPRTQAIFEWIFGIEGGAAPYHLHFVATPDTGLSPEAVAARVEREMRSLSNVRALSGRLTTFRDLHEWLFAEHAAYAVGLPATAMDQNVLKSY